jgi:hypothetical protein
MQLRAERFEFDETLQAVETAALRIMRFAVIPGRALRANPESRNRAPLLDSGSAPKRAHPGMTNQSLKAGCDKAAPVTCLMLHLRSRYVSKAAILTVPVLHVLVENRSPA